jgi:hypothetical protein
MEFLIACPKCKSKTKFPSEDICKKVQCGNPECGHTFVSSTDMITDPDYARPLIVRELGILSTVTAFVGFCSLIGFVISLVNQSGSGAVTSFCTGAIFWILAALLAGVDYCCKSLEQHLRK